MDMSTTNECADDLLERERLIDLFTKGQIVVLHPVLQALDLFDTFSSASGRLPLFGQSTISPSTQTARRAEPT